MFDFSILFSSDFDSRTQLEQDIRNDVANKLKGESFQKLLENVPVVNSQDFLSTCLLCLSICSSQLHNASSEDNIKCALTIRNNETSLVTVHFVQKDCLPVLWHALLTVENCPNYLVKIMDQTILYRNLPKTFLR